MNRVLSVVVVILCALEIRAGISYRVEQVNEGLRAQKMVAIAKSEGGKSRLDIIASDTKLFEAGSILLTSNASRAMTIVNPAKKTYYVIDFDQLMNATSDMRKSLDGLVGMEKPVVNVESKGSGGNVQGFPTQRSVIRYRQDVRLAGQKGSQRIEMTSEIWTTDKLPAEASIAVDGFAKPGDPMTGPLAGTQAKIKGFPLKTVTSTTLTLGGSTTRTKSRTTITEIRQATFPPALFAIPAGYKKVESPIDAMLSMAR